MSHLLHLSLGKLTALLTVGAVALVLWLHGQHMFSPGPLNAESRRGEERGGVRSHAAIGGNCAACHAPPWSGETMADRCMTCHTDVREQLAHKQAMHGLLTAGQQCTSCHTEHKGPHAPLTDLAAFDHDCAAFKLTGNHRAVDCKTCHTTAVYKGTPQTCVSCHAEPKEHKGRFGTDCGKCHGTTAWQASTTTLTKFNHDLTGYRLTGKHRAVDCKSCHVNEAFKGTPQNCTSCHTEPKVHKGRYGLDCASCHATSSWEDVTFRHGFPINHGGNQKANSCTTCHTNLLNLESYTCYGCHRHNPVQEKQRSAHRNVANLDKCTVCHPAGRGHVRPKKTAQGDLPVADVALGCPDMGLAPHQACAFLAPTAVKKSAGRQELLELLRGESTVVSPKHTTPLAAVKSAIHPPALTRLTVPGIPLGGDPFGSLLPRHDVRFWPPNASQQTAAWSW